MIETLILSQQKFTEQIYSLQLQLTEQSNNNQILIKRLDSLEHTYRLTQSQKDINNNTNELKIDLYMKKYDKSMNEINELAIKIEELTDLQTQLKNREHTNNQTQKQNLNELKIELKNEFKNEFKNELKIIELNYSELLLLINNITLKINKIELIENNIENTLKLNENNINNNINDILLLKNELKIIKNEIKTEINEKLYYFSNELLNYKTSNEIISNLKLKLNEFIINTQNNEKLNENNFNKIDNSMNSFRSALGMYLSVCLCVCHSFCVCLVVCMSHRISLLIVILFV